MNEKFNSLYNEEALSAYVAEIKRFPLLDSDEEFQLATRWKEKGDRKALDKIVKSHLRLVVKIAKGYSGYGLSKVDLISEGNVGIMCALQHYDPSVGYRFSTYAAWWIKSKMQDFIYNSWSIVKLGASKNNRKLFFSLRKIKNLLGINSLSSKDAEIVAKKLEVRTEDVMISEQRFANKDFSANAAIGEDGESSFQDFIADQKASPETLAIEKQEYEYRKKILHDALNTLSKREYEVVCSHRLRNPTKTLQKIAEEMNVSAERIRQIDNAAFLKIQKYVRMNDRSSLIA
ncbi:MAG: RNA polymerase factor sigma-32 [Holosporaceae bacterium]|jgi:RNA polymerase sigma-32 factor|nr:RNA polymerase factor sigma-32 [Holosporaceae bacterium]